MDYANCKVYSDGSHYIAIPYEPNPRARKIDTETEIDQQLKNEDYTMEEIQPHEQEEDYELGYRIDYETGEILESEEFIETLFARGQEQRQKTRQEKKETYSKAEYKLMFEFFYSSNYTMKRKALRKLLVERLKPYFESEEKTVEFVDENLARKARNAICRRKRLARKVNLEKDFNYFCTFTYDDQKHDEESFKKKLRTTFRHLTERKGWKYAGVWERSPEKQRLHFHGMFVIPQGTMPGELISVTDFDTRDKKMRTTIQNTYFNERFGRSDFSPIESHASLGQAMQYLMKYIAKTGEKIVYSKNLPQYFYSDIKGEDIICDCGNEGKKKLLFDDFACYDNGEYKGKVSKEVIDTLRKEN